ncbi:hypothetical protein J6590_018182 [Homalodisca vitripennis]|nr:hypothetical protein J6590_018182 [Homalodisca vitripennis]
MKADSAQMQDIDRSTAAVEFQNGGTLGAYTPRKMGTGEWQLGVTPVQQPSTSPAPLQPPPQDHLKPAPPESTVVWSEDTASDLLF